MTNPRPYSIYFIYKGANLLIHLWDTTREKARYRAAQTAAASFHCSTWEALLHVVSVKVRKNPEQMPLF